MANEEQVIGAVRAYAQTYFTRENTSPRQLEEQGLKPADRKDWSLDEDESPTLSVKDAMIEEHPDEYSWIVGVLLEPEIVDPQFFLVTEHEDTSLSVQWCGN